MRRDVAAIYAYAISAVIAYLLRCRAAVF